MKKILKTSVVFLLIAALSACGVLNPAVNDPNETREVATETTEETTGTGEADAEGTFSVSLVYNGEPFISADPITVQWTDGFSYHTAEIDGNGRAWVTGLDGDYQVTLSSVPSNLAYNANAYTATNVNPHLTIELYPVTRTRGDGTELYKCIELNLPGVYQVELTNPDQVVLYQFTPRQSGVYSIESWMDVTANNINPMLDVYTGSSAFKVFSHVQDDGGATSHYTKNFKHEVKIADEQIGNAFTFGVKATRKDGEISSENPVKVTFVVQLDGGFELNRITSTYIAPMYESIYTAEQYAYIEAELAPYVSIDEYGQKQYNGTFVGCETKKKGDNIFDGDNYGYNEETGFYHVINQETGEPTGPILFAYVSVATRFIDKPFTSIEDEGNKALTVSNGTENYKLFIEGFGSLVNKGYFCVESCPCRQSGNGGACLESEHCEKCHEECNPVPDALHGQIGYAGASFGGLCPVTQELKDFLQKFSISQLLFMDGNGFVETNPDISVYATEDDQWLFACGYYLPAS